MSNPPERTAINVAAAKKAIKEMGVEDRCHVLVGGEPPEPPTRWFVNIKCDGEVISASANYESDSAEEHDRRVSRAVKKAIHEKLNLPE